MRPLVRQRIVAPPQGDRPSSRRRRAARRPIAAALGIGERPPEFRGPPAHFTVGIYRKQSVRPPTFLAAGICVVGGNETHCMPVPRANTAGPSVKSLAERGIMPVARIPASMQVFDSPHSKQTSYIRNPGLRVSIARQRPSQERSHRSVADHPASPLTGNVDISLAKPLDYR